MSEVLGIDIGSYAIKVASVSGGGSGNAQVTHLASTYNPVGQFLPSDQGDFQKLADTIKQFLGEQKLRGRQIHVLLPESLAYTSVISMPFLSEAELASSIHWEAEQHIPVPIDEINLEYQVLYKPKKGQVGEKMRILLVGARKDIIERLVQLFHSAGTEVVGVETILLGLYRSLTPFFVQGQTSIVVHMGALSTDVLIVRDGEIVLTYTIQTGGLAFTRSVEKGLELPPAQAEEYKRVYGMDPGQLEGRVRQVLMPVVNILVAEIRKAIQFYQTSNMTSPVRTMMLSGGSAYLPALSTFFAETFGYEVLLANPLELSKPRHGLAIPQDVAAYCPVIGMGNKKDE